MSKSDRLKLILVALIPLTTLSLLVLGVTGWLGLFPADDTPVQPLPDLMLWAWERSEDLSFLDPAEAGVAYLAGRLVLQGDEAITIPRTQPLRLPPGARVQAVIRIESDPARPASFSIGQLDYIVSEIVWLSGGPSVEHLQIDFDARVSEREGYRRLLENLRRRLDPAAQLSITALASWCLFESWVETLPIDAAVPMLFQMGAEGPRVLDWLSRGRECSGRLTRSDIGFSTAEQAYRPPSRKRIYLFHPQSWTEEEYRRAKRFFNRSNGG